MAGEARLGAHYDDAFYGEHIDASLGSARVFLAHVWKYYQPSSVIDVGCGRGAWLKAARELGAQTLIGYDGSWNNQQAMLEPEIQFRSTDLERATLGSEKVDLAMSLEVAEHIAPEASERFVRALTGASDAVLFSAAYTGQGGAHHVNERPHSEWAALFAAQGYSPFDLFRPFFWGDERVRYWYRQNAFLYLKNGTAVYERFSAAGFAPLPRAEFMDCVHPTLYDQRRFEPASLRTHVVDFFPSVLRTLKHRLRR